MKRVTVIPWFRNFIVGFLKQESNDCLHAMGIRYERQFPDDQWRTGKSFFVLDFLDSEIEALTASDGFQRIYDYMKEVRRKGWDFSAGEPRTTGKPSQWEYNYVTHRMYEFTVLAGKLTDGKANIITKKRKVPPVSAPVPETILIKDEVQCPAGCLPSNYNKHKEHAQRVLDELQACVVIAGGSKISIQELSTMTLAEVLFMCLPNNINIKASLKQLPRTMPLLT